MRYFYIFLTNIVFLLIIYFSFKQNNKVIEYNEELSFDMLLENIKKDFSDMTGNTINYVELSNVMYEKELNKRAKILNSLKKCIYGSINDKNYIKDIIFDLLEEKYINEKNIDSIIDFSSYSFLTVVDMFDIIMYYYKKIYNQDAFKIFIEENDFFNLNNNELNYEINEDDIRKIFYKKNIYLTYDDKLRIISQRIYQQFKGFSVVDELRDMNIDGISAGVSGVISDSILNSLNDIKNYPKNYESIWIFFKGKSIHLSFLSFVTYNELKRVCQNIYRYNNIGMLSNDEGYKISDMIDGSRVVVVRPNFSESWAFFVRKFNSTYIELDKIIKGKNSKFVISLIEFLAKGNCITSITGAQASGKTTLLMAMIGKIYPFHTIRVQELAFELNLRRLYPKRNILSFRETNKISGQMGLDLQKKTDGSVQIIGEIATDDVASWMIQTAQVASAFTIFTHHAKTVKDLVLSLRNSLLKCDIFSNESIAEEQVINVLNFDIHLNKDYDGRRYIERITEIIPLNLEIDNNIYNQKKYLEEQNIQKNEKYKIVDIIVYEDNKYKIKNNISCYRYNIMKKYMINDDIYLFEKFYNNINYILENSIDFYNV